MPDPHANNLTDSPASESFGTFPHRSEAVGTVPNPSERVGTVPHRSEPFRPSRNTTERNHSHTLTVREAARLFEVAGVTRTERSIVKWCLPNKHDVARLDAFFDASERRWFITPESVERAIAEEKAKAARHNDTVPPGSEAVGTARPATDENDAPAPNVPGASTGRVRRLEQEVLDLKILNGGKDHVIELLRKERGEFIHQIATASREVGRLETELRQLAEPRNRSEPLPHESDGTVVAQTP